MMHLASSHVLAAGDDVLILLLTVGLIGWALYELVAHVARRQAHRVLSQRDFTDLRMLLDSEISA